MKFMECDRCKNIIIFLQASGVTPICCGETMKEIIAGSVDGSLEKHVPVIRDVKGTEHIVTVEVGESAHPMMDAHYIQWILLETDKGIYINYLNPTDKPLAKFRLESDERVEEAYAYCNIHGLWRNEEGMKYEERKTHV